MSNRNEYIANRIHSVRDLAELEAGLRDHWQKWLVPRPARQQFARAEVLDAVRDFYSIMNLPEPILVFCQSPLQMMLIKAVLQYGLTPLEMRLLLGQLDRDRSVRVWDKLYANLQSDVNWDLRKKLAQEFRRHIKVSRHPWRVNDIQDPPAIWSDLGAKARKWLTLNPPLGAANRVLTSLIRTYQQEFPFADNVGLDLQTRAFLIECVFNELTERREEDLFLEALGEASIRSSYSTSLYRPA